MDLSQATCLNGAVSYNKMKAFSLSATEKANLIGNLKVSSSVSLIIYSSSGAEVCVCVCVCCSLCRRTLLMCVCMHGADVRVHGADVRVHGADVRMHGADVRVHNSGVHAHMM